MCIVSPLVDPVPGSLSRGTLTSDTMTLTPPRDVLLRIRKLAGLPAEIRDSRWAVSVTRLTVLKSLCRQPDLANRFVAHLARKAVDYGSEEHGRSAHHIMPTEGSHGQMIDDALEGMTAWRRSPSEKMRRTLFDLLGRMRAEQNEHRNIPFGAIRLITDSKLLLVEYALACHLAHEREVGTWAYQTARHYAERYEPSRGTGLVPASLPFVQEIVDFWMTEYALTPESLRPAPKAARAPGTTPAKSSSQADFTPHQGQFLAFIHLYRKLHRRGPAEADLRAFFRVTPPSVHGMIVKLEELGLITREPGVARSIRVTVPAEQLPELEEVAGPPW
jgi:DNA-binding MarR family transcriptional regulator